MKIRQKLIRLFGTWIILLIFLGLFRPQNLPVVVLIVPFMLLFAALYTAWDLAVALRIRFLLHAESGNMHRQLGFAICMSAVLLLILQSLGQLSTRDVVTLVAIVSLGYVYLVRNKFGVQKH